MAKNDDIIDLDKLPEQSPESFRNFVDRFVESLPKVPEPPIELANIELKTQLDDSLSYNEARGLLKINGESVKFTLDKKMSELLRAIFSEGLEKEWGWDEIIEFWEEAPGDYGSNIIAADMIFNTSKNINKRVSADTGCKNFLIVTRKKVKINPKYIS